MLTNGTQTLIHRGKVECMSQQTSLTTPWPQILVLYTTALKGCFKKWHKKADYSVKFRSTGPLTRLLYLMRYQWRQTVSVELQTLCKAGFLCKKSEAHLEIWKMKSSGLLFQLPPERNKTLNNCLHRLHLLYLMCKISRASLKATIPEHVLGKEQKLVVNKQRDIIHEQICGESNKTCSEVQQSHRLLILLSTQPQINQSDNIHDKNVITCSKYLAWWQKRLRVLEGVMAANATVTNIYASSTNASLKYTHTRHRLKLCLTNQKPASSTCFIIQRSPGLTLSRHDMACVRIWRVVPLRKRRRSFPFSNSRVRLCSLCPSAWSSIPEFHRVLNFREMLSSAICLGLGLNLKRRLLRPSKLTTSESEEARKTHTLNKVHSCLCLSRHSEEDDTLTLTECRSATSLTPTVSLSKHQIKNVSCDASVTGCDEFEALLLTLLLKTAQTPNYSKVHFSSTFLFRWNKVKACFWTNRQACYFNI